MVLAVVDDLLFSSKIRAVALTVGRAATFVRDRASVIPGIRTHRPDVVIFDLDREELDPIGAIREIRLQDDIKRVRIIGYASHVQAARFAEARDAGIDVAMARSGFVAALPKILSGDWSVEG